MLLVDQVKLLRENLASIRQQKNFALPLMGDLFKEPKHTRATYKFKSLILPARDIATTIAQADPGGNKLPVHLRGWNVDGVDDLETTSIPLKNLLGMVIHTYYLRIGDDHLDVINDYGKRIIVPYERFLRFVERLVLSPSDVWLVVCALAEAKIEKLPKDEEPSPDLMEYTPGLGDLQLLLQTLIQGYPDLEAIFWKTVSPPESAEVNPDQQVRYNGPLFVKSSRFPIEGSTSRRTVMWNIAWRKNDKWMDSWVNVLDLAAMIKDYFHSETGLSRLDYNP